MATRTLYWVGGTGNWSDAAHWSLASGGAGGEVAPDSDDDVHFNAASNTTTYTVTVDATPICRDFMVDAAPSASGTVSFGQSAATFYIYGSIKLLPGMVNNLGLIDWRPASGSKTLTSNGVNVSRHLLLRATVGATMQLADDLTFLANWSTLFQYISGTFDPNGKTVTLPSAVTGPHSLYGAHTLYNLTYAQGAGTGAGIILDSNITVSGTLTISGSVATNRPIVQSSVLGTPRTITAAAAALGHVDFMDIVGAGPATWQGALSAESITTAADRDFTSDSGHWVRGAGITIAGSSLRFTSAASLTLAYLQQPTYLTLTAGKTYRIAYTIQNYVAGGVQLYPGGTTLSTVTRAANGNYVETILADAGGRLYFAAIGTTTLDVTNLSVMEVSPLGNCLGNSGITFPRSEYMVWKTPTTGTKTWSTVGNWFISTNGGGGAGRVPLPQDNVIFDANSIGAAGTTVSADMPRSGKDVTWTGVTNAPLFNPSVAWSLYGSLTLGAGMTASNGGAIHFSGRGSHTLNFAGVAITGAGQSYFYKSVGGTYTAQSALTFSALLALYDGTFVDGGYSITAQAWFMSGTTTRALNATGAWTLTGTGGVNGVWNDSTSTNLTLISAPSTIKLTDATATAKYFYGGGKTYGNIWFAGAGSGSFNFTGSNTIADFKVDNLPKNIQFTAGTNTTLASFTAPAYNPADVKFVRCDGTSTCFFSTSDTAAVSNVGDQQFEVLFTPKTTDTGVTLGGHWFNPTDRAWALNLGVLTPTYYWSVDGTTAIFKTATVALIAGVEVWLQVRHDVDNGAAGNDVSFWTAPNVGGVPGTYTQLGTTLTTAGVTSVFNSTAPLTIGGNNGGANRTIDVYRAKYYASIGGAVAADFNPNDWNGGNTWPSSTTGETWTRNGSALIYPEIKISSSTAATHTLTKTGGGVVALRKANVAYSIASPANTFYAGAESTNGGNNTNWLWQNIAVLSGDAAAAAVASGALDAGIALAGVALSVAGVGGTLTTAIPLAAAAVAVSAADGILNAQITLSGAALAEAAAAAGLDTGIPFDGLAGGAAAASGTLTVQIVLSGDAAAAAGAGGELTAKVELSAVAIAQAVASGSLTTEIPLAAFAQAQASAAADIATRPRIHGYRLEASHARVTHLLSRDARIEQ